MAEETISQYVPVGGKLVDELLKFTKEVYGGGNTTDVSGSVTLDKADMEFLRVDDDDTDDEAGSAASESV